MGPYNFSALGLHAQVRRIAVNQHYHHQHHPGDLGLLVDHFTIFVCVKEEDDKNELDEGNVFSHNKQTTPICIGKRRLFIRRNKLSPFFWWLQNT
jgi:hypothetical protein